MERLGIHKWNVAVGGGYTRFEGLLTVATDDGEDVVCCMGGQSLSACEGRWIVWEESTSTVGEERLTGQCYIYNRAA